MKGKEVDVPQCETSCPYCGSRNTELMEFQGIALGETNDMRVSLDLNSVLICSTSKQQKAFKSGVFHFCNNCKELFFVYRKEDSRTCANCQHYKNNSCTWYDVSESNYNHRIYKEFHCEHIDDDPVKINPMMRCFLCEHSSQELVSDFVVTDGVSKEETPKAKVRTFCDCIKFRNYWNKKDVTEQKRVCMEFKPSYTKYKNYREIIENDLIRFDEIFIPEFDKKIQEEKNG